jgi:hypothetical protein
MVRRHRILLLLGVVAVLGACNATQTPIGDERVDAGYQIRRVDGRTDASPYQLFLFVKATPLDGKLRVCGATVADMSDERFAHYRAALHDLQSYLIFTAANGRRQVVRPGFITVARAAIPTGPDGRPRLPPGVTATCIATEAAWDASYRREPFAVDLRESRIKPVFRPYP